MQSGRLKDLSLRLRQATVRSSAFESDLEEVRLICRIPDIGRAVALTFARD